jgi:tetratricopeptide (TPR) repeat protein
LSMDRLAYLYPSPKDSTACREVRSVYKRFEPSERIFVNREEYLEWMEKALRRCKNKSVVLHLKGIGGIGKSSLLDHWTCIIESNIRVDCEQYSDFYDRLNVLAKGVVLHGVNLQRFDVLWQIRQRFVEGVEPVREEGREWAKEVVMAIPFIGSLASIGSAISAVGTKVSPKLKGKFSTVGKWLEERLGKKHVERLLEILWKEPHHAEFLYLDALLEDINCRKNSETPLLFMMDHFEYVDNEKTKWRYEVRQITETELWGVFLCSLSNSVGVMASRRAAIAQLKDQIEESELLELNRESSNEFLRLRRISDTKLQDKIVGVSGGNPFVIGAICDLIDTGDVSFEDIEDLGADTLEEVRIKTWRRLFNEAHDLTPFIDRAGLLPFFNRRIVNIIAPDMKAEQWDRMIRLSFVRNMGDETYVLHDLAEELVIAELSDRLKALSEEVAARLEKASKEKSDLILLGLAISSLARTSPRDAIDKIALEFQVQIATGASATVSDFIKMLEILRIDTTEGKLAIQDWRGFCLFQLGRFAECEYILSEALITARELANNQPSDFLLYVGRILYHLARFYVRVGRWQEADESFKESITTFNDLLEKYDLLDSKLELPRTLGAWGVRLNYGTFLKNTNRLIEAEKMLQESYDFSKEIPESDFWWNRQNAENLILSTLAAIRISIGKPLDAELTTRKIVEATTFQQLDPVFRASIFGHLCRVLRKTNRPYDAEEYLRKSMEIAMFLYQKEPSVEWVTIAEESLTLGKLMMQTSRYTDAEEMFNKALELVRKYASEEDPYILALTHAHLGVLNRELNRFPEAAISYDTSLKIFSNLIETSPAHHGSNIADCLNNYALLLQKTGKLKHAEESYAEALQISRELCKSNPEDVEVQNRVGSVLNNYGVLLRKMSKLEEAEKLLNESLDIRKTLVKVSPDMFDKHLAWTLNNLGIVFLDKKELSKSLKYLKDSLKLLRKLAEKTEDMFLPSLAAVLTNLSVVHNQSGNKDEAKKSVSEVTEIKDLLVRKDPRVFKDRFTIETPEEIEEVLLDF